MLGIVGIMVGENLIYTIEYLFMAVKKNAKTYTIWLGRIAKKLRKDC